LEKWGNDALGLLESAHWTQEKGSRGEGKEGLGNFEGKGDRSGGLRLPFLCATHSRQRSGIGAENKGAQKDVGSKLNETGKQEPLEGQKK